VLDNIRAEGVIIHEGSKVTSGSNGAARPASASITKGGSGEASSTAPTFWLLTGRLANVEGLDLDKPPCVEHDRRGIKVGANLKTSNRVYAIGDVAGGLQFTHVAGYHAGLVVQQILFRLPGKENRDIIPWATYTDPELAHVGTDEEEAPGAMAARISVLRWPYAENDRAQAERKTDGLIKLVVDRKAASSACPSPAPAPAR
jgi:pyruvate/2-oxoglutarate dehydrogenase complex dihydrolipoamide dehydrogenase (E3) component